MLLSELVATSAALTATPGRRAKVEELAGLLARADPEALPLVVSYLTGEIPQGAIGVGWAALQDLPSPAEPPPSLYVREVDRAFQEMSSARGPGSRASRHRALAELFRRATQVEQRFLVALLAGELRQGALVGAMTDAVAKVARLPSGEVRRALMLAGDLGRVAEAAILGGDLSSFRLTVMRPVLPMLAQSAPDPAAAMEGMASAAVEWKLDGARLQVHRLGLHVRAFTRNLADVSERVPEVIGSVGRLPLESVILDGEVIALTDDARPLPFQVTMGRFGSSVDVDRLRDSLPLTLFLFDCLHLDGEDLIDRPGAERFGRLRERVPPGLLVPRSVAHDPTEAETVLADALAQGHEGIVVKSLEATYAAGRRGRGWVKVKRARTLDLVVLAAEWGHGRRRGWLSNLHLGARDDLSGDFIMLGKTFKGMTDEMLRWQTERLLGLETRREGITVFVRPELVVEVAFDGLQKSSRYPGGLALRFARIKGYRLDKQPEEADTIATVRALA